MVEVEDHLPLGVQLQPRLKGLARLALEPPDRSGFALADQGEDLLLGELLAGHLLPDHEVAPLPEPIAPVPPLALDDSALPA